MKNSIIIGRGFLATGAFALALNCIPALADDSMNPAIAKDFNFNAAASLSSDELDSSRGGDSSLLNENSSVSSGDIVTIGQGGTFSSGANSVGNGSFTGSGIFSNLMVTGSQNNITMQTIVNYNETAAAR